MNYQFLLTQISLTELNVMTDNILSGQAMPGNVTLFNVYNKSFIKIKCNKLFIKILFY